MKIIFIFICFFCGVVVGQLKYELSPGGDECSELIRYVEKSIIEKYPDSELAREREYNYLRKLMNETDIDNITKLKKVLAFFGRRELVDNLKLASERGYAPAQYLLGWCYRVGKGTSADIITAFEQFNKAAQQGYAPAQFILGYCYHHGEGIVCDMSKAVLWYAKSAEQNNYLAQRNLAWCYMNGMGIEKK